MAEICGIHVGDGYLRNDGRRKELDISGGYEEKEYYDTHVIPLFNKVFNPDIKGRFFPSRSTYGFVIRDIKVIKFMHEQIGFPYGSKSLIIGVPKFIREDISLIPYFLRGYFDTDGCLNFTKQYGNYSEFNKTRHCYPRIIFSTVSSKLFKDLQKVLILVGFKLSIYNYQPKRGNENLRYIIALYGKTNLNAWLNMIGMKNPTKYSKFLIWKKFGFCPSNTNSQQRRRILKGELHPRLLY
ncbi:hypothetical protein KY341_03375 [Candidatus Woesearchaeota archaeon]|nr:hypothetical protein [Candidatus Woesearchaeota archaeon]